MVNNALSLEINDACARYVSVGLGEGEGEGEEGVLSG